MPPRRVLPIRSRLDNGNPCNQKSDDATTAGERPNPSASSGPGGRLVCAAPADHGSPSFLSKKHTPNYQNGINKVGEGSIDMSSNSTSGGGATKARQALSAADLLDTHEIMEDIIVAIVNGRRVSVKVKLKTRKDETKPNGLEADASSSDARPKRKRNNLYSSLAPAVMNAMVERRAMAYAEAPQRLYKKAKGNVYRSPKVDPKDVHPAVLVAEAAQASSGGKVPQEYLGQDGNLFYCRICLGVGEVVCCDGCPMVFHPSCIPPGLSKSSLDNDDDPWYCPECVEKGMRGKSIDQLNGKKKKAKKDKDCAVEEDTTHTSPPRRPKKRCGTCNKNEVENFPLVECSKQSCTRLMHFPGCPTRVDQDEYAYVHPNFGGPLCHLCASAIRAQKKTKSKKEEQKKKSGGRGISKGGHVKGKSRGSNGANSKLSPPHKPIEKMKPSGYQAPYVEDDGDNVGPHSLAFVEEPKKSIPAFFLFLINNRSAIERSLNKKNRAFRTMTKGFSKNELVAEAGGAIWLTLTDREKRAWVDLAINDFQDRVMAWKEKEAIDSMTAVGKEEQPKHREHRTTIESKVTPADDQKHATDFRTRTLQFSRIKTSLMKPIQVQGIDYNSVLLELLQDGRFNPVPLFNSCRSKKDLVSMHGERAVEQFAVQGPIKSGIGDECMGCVRGWRHVCPVLKRTLPKSTTRAALQPPTGSLSASRIGLGLKYFREDNNESHNYLQDPSLRRDDVTAFIEDAMGVKTLMPGPDEHIYESKTSEVDSSNEIGASRKRNRLCADDIDNGCNINKRLYKCSRCSTVTYSPFGCIRCRREHLIRETAFRDYISTSSITSDFLHGSKALSNSHNYDEGFLKSKCVMLRQTTVELGEGSSLGERQCKTNQWLTKEGWTPNVILPPETGHNPSLSEETECLPEMKINDSSDSSTAESSSISSNEMNDPEENTALTNPDEANPDEANPDGQRKRRRSVADPDAGAHPNRQIVAKKHKESADELSRKCLSIACSGILMGMIRRDPLRLFAKPAPSSMKDYYKAIQDPIDFETMREKLVSNEYITLGSFINDAKRLCINACVFNAADSVYALTAKQIYDSLLVMIKRAQQWITILKNTHASNFICNDDDYGGSADIFKDVELMWPGAVELLNTGDWLEQEAQTNFARTKENEMAYYGALALRRASVAAGKSVELAPAAVTKRSHVEDEMVRELVDNCVSLLNGPACITNQPDWREEQLLKLLKTVQKQRIDSRRSSDAGCARCEVIKSENDRNEAVSILRTNAKAVSTKEKKRVDSSRSDQTTGLVSSRNARNSLTTHESDTSVANGAMVSVEGSGIHGWGLFADTNFREGSVVAEYIGEYISSAVADFREQYYRKQRIQDYQFRVNENIVIDATVKGGYARYINHSCEPNCVTKIIEGEPPDMHLMRVMIIAKRDIKATEELSYDYHFPLETDLNNRVPCNCGSKNCRGYMNWDIPENLKKWKGNKKVGQRGRASHRKM